MTAVLFAPHNDDECVFAGFLAMQHQAEIIVVLRSQVQWDRGLGISAQQREKESACAAQEMGLSFAQWPYPDSDPDWGAVTVAMRTLDERLNPELVFAPAWESEGHEQHNQVADLANGVFGNRVAHYTTYVRGYGRTETDTPVIGTPDQIGRKLRALSCYRSQIGEPSTQPWFLDGLTEYLA